RAEEVARAFTVYFHLVNLAEEHHRARGLRERDGRGPQPESLAATVAELQRKHGRRRLREMLASLEVHPPPAAHPAEARPPARVRVGRWVGGDRDGNESVTAAAPAEPISIQAEPALLAFEAAPTRIGRAITVDAATTPPGRDLRRRLAALRAAAPARWAEVEKRSPSEPHRQFLLHIADRVRSTRTGTGKAY